MTFFMPFRYTLNWENNGKFSWRSGFFSSKYIKAPGSGTETREIN